MMAARDPDTAGAPVRLRGVNLGGWLVLEKWMTPSLFEGLAATDETTWCAELGAAGARRGCARTGTASSRATTSPGSPTRGINAVRIPRRALDLRPAVSVSREATARTRIPFVEGGIDVLDRALDWAAEFGLRVVLDLHAAPGCQNGFDNGGIKDVCEWHTREEYLAHSRGRARAARRALPRRPAPCTRSRC